MKVIDAYWEKENIGVETKEILVEKTDNKIDVLKQLKEITAEYLVLKVPSDFESLSFELYNLGYVFMETMNQLSNDLHLKPLNEKKRSIVLETDFVEMTQLDFDYMCERIMGELMFRTDRIARDPYFSLEQANRRYVNWLHSERDKGASLYKFVYKGNNVGFLAFKDMRNGVVEDFLSGIYSEFTGRGLSINVPVKLADYCKKINGNKLMTNVSSTNVPSLKKCISGGYVIDSSNYIFVKHQTV